MSGGIIACIVYRRRRRSADESLQTTTTSGTDADSVTTANHDVCRSLYALRRVFGKICIAEGYAFGTTSDGVERAAQRSQSIGKRLGFLFVVTHINIVALERCTLGSESNSQDRIETLNDTLCSMSRRYRSN